MSYPNHYAAVIVPTADLLYQWQQNLFSLSIPAAEVGLCGDGHQDRLGDQRVTVYAAMSAASHLPTEVASLGHHADVLLALMSATGIGQRASRERFARITARGRVL